MTFTFFIGYLQTWNSLHCGPFSSIVSLFRLVVTKSSTFPHTTLYTLEFICIPLTLTISCFSLHILTLTSSWSVLWTAIVYSLLHAHFQLLRFHQNTTLVSPLKSAWLFCPSTLVPSPEFRISELFAFDLLFEKHFSDLLTLFFCRSATLLICSLSSLLTIVTVGCSLACLQFDA